LFRFLAHSLTTFGRWGCGERWDHSRCDADPFFFCTGVIRSSGAHGIVRYAGWWKVGGNGNNSPLPVKGRVVCRSRYAGRSQGHRSRGASVEEPAPA
ncbi:hypothetical protein GAY52_14010, partial [Staphylococcus aureus]|nr:hypothetical protein [Staphylococcus aureus]